VCAVLVTLALYFYNCIVYRFQVTAQDEKHARYRNALNPLFLQPIAVASYADAIAQEVLLSNNL
jgi:cytochrome P450